MLKPMVEEVAFMPSTVPLSMSLPAISAVEPFQMASNPIVPVPVSGLVRAACLLLKVFQSVLFNKPLTPLAAVGRLKVKTLVEEEILKSVPVVPVARAIAGPVAPFIEVMPEALPQGVV